MKIAGNLIEEWMKKKGIYKSYKYRQAVECWSEVVGKKIAENSRAVKVESGVLWVKVRNSVWLQHLSMLKKQIMWKINEYTGYNSIRDIYFFQGNVDEEYENKKGIYRNRLDYKEPDNRLDPKEIEGLIKNVSNKQPEVREKIKSLLYKRYNYW